jgi:hypothetical protein
LETKERLAQLGQVQGGQKVPQKVVGAQKGRLSAH